MPLCGLGSAVHCSVFSTEEKQISQVGLRDQARRCKPCQTPTPVLMDLCPVSRLAQKPEPGDPGPVRHPTHYTGKPKDPGQARPGSHYTGRPKDPNQVTWAPLNFPPWGSWSLPPYSQAGMARLTLALTDGSFNLTQSTQPPVRLTYPAPCQTES